MPSDNHDNLKRWLEQSDIDYFAYFVKAWIPFNAWYRQAYDTLHQERAILDQVKSDSKNRIRSRFIAKLKGSDPESGELRNLIASLHRRLSGDPLVDRKGNAVSFEKVLIGPNSLNFNDAKHGHWFYRVERIANSKNIVSTITSNRGRVHRKITQTNGWNIEEFELNPDYLSLNPGDKSRLRQCYIVAHPFNFISLVPSPPPPDGILMDKYTFINDEATIFAGLVETLYSMRNLLFHGELVPDTQTNQTYEPAYHLVRQLTRFII